MKTTTKNTSQHFNYQWSLGLKNYHPVTELFGFPYQRNTKDPWPVGNYFLENPAPMYNQYPILVSRNI